jgi:hypothetical protein
LRALLIAGAEPGTRIVRALIPRRASLPETGECGPLPAGGSTRRVAAAVGKGAAVPAQQN